MGLPDELAKLAVLRHSGALTDEEFAIAKSKLLGEGSSARPQESNASSTRTPIDAEPNSPTSAPTWMKPAGWFAVGLGILAFLASVASEPTPKNGNSGYWAGALLSGVLNPLFFVGVPLGLYWLTRSGIRLIDVKKAIEQLNQSTLSEKERRKLVEQRATETPTATSDAPLKRDENNVVLESQSVASKKSANTKSFDASKEINQAFIGCFLLPLAITLAITVVGLLIAQLTVIFTRSPAHPTITTVANDHELIVNRIESKLRDMGDSKKFSPTWRHYSGEDLLKIESSVDVTNRLRALGANVDFGKYTLEELEALEQRLIKMQREADRRTKSR